jgi:hypothetical protein
LTITCFHLMLNLYTGNMSLWYADRTNIYCEVEGVSIIIFFITKFKVLLWGKWEFLLHVI